MSQKLEVSSVFDSIWEEINEDSVSKISYSGRGRDISGFNVKIKGADKETYLKIKQLLEESGYNIFNEEDNRFVIEKSE